MAARKRAPPSSPPKAKAKLDASTLDELVGDAWDRFKELKAELARDGVVVESEQGPRADPRVKILQEEREWVRKVWATKFQGGDAINGKGNYFKDTPEG